METATIAGSARSQFLRSVSWTASSTGFGQLLAFVRSLILARLLTPDDYGLFGMATLTIYAVSILTEFNLTGVVYTLKYDSEEDRRSHLDTAWTVDLIRKAAVTVILMLSSGWISDFFQDERIYSLLLVASLNPVISGFTNVGLVQLQKDLSFGRVVLHTQITEVVTAITAILVAWATRSVWALVVGLVVSSCAGVALSYLLCDHRPRLRFHRSALKESLQFGKHMFVIGLLTFVTTQFDNLVVGRYLGAAVLGAYMLAYRLANFPVAIVSSVLGSVLFPLYAKINQERPEELVPALLKIANLTSTILLMMLGPMAFLGGPLIRFLYGEKWVSAIPFLTVLLLVGLFRGFPRGINGMFAAIRRPDVSSSSKVLEVAIFIPLTLYLVREYGAIGAAWAGVASYFTGWVYQLVRVRQVLPVRRNFVLRRLLTPAMAGAVAFLFCAAAGTYGAPPIVLAISFEVLVAGFVLLLDREIRGELRRLKMAFVASPQREW